MRVLFPLSHLELHSRRRRVVPSVCRALPLHATAFTSARVGPTIFALPQTLARPPDSRALLQLAPGPAHPGWCAPSATCARAALCARCTGVPFASPFLGPGPSTAPLLPSFLPSIVLRALSAGPAHTAPYLHARSRRTSRPQLHSASSARWVAPLLSQRSQRLSRGDYKSEQLCQSMLALLCVAPLSSFHPSFTHAYSLQDLLYHILVAWHLSLRARVTTCTVN
jgi:hypothetical protein